MPKSGDTVRALFVGRPSNGRREEVRYSERIVVPVLDKLVPVIGLSLSPTMFKQVVYLMTQFGDQKMRFVIYAEESLTADDVMGMLWDCYAPLS